MTRTVLFPLILSSMIAVAVAGQATADTVWATESLDALRWSDNADVKVGTVEPGTPLDVVFRESGWVRVRITALDKFGWLPEAKVTTVAPEAPTRPTLDLGGDFSTTLPPINLDLP